MRGQTKIAVGVGAALIGLGIWYFGGGENKSSPSAAFDGNSAPADRMAEQPKAGENPAGDTGGSDGQNLQAEATSHGSPIASPTPRSIDEGRLAGLSKDSRPQPLATDEPAPPISISEFPPERAGLSSIEGIAPAAISDASPSIAASDVPPNVDKNAAQIGSEPGHGGTPAAAGSTTKPAAEKSIADKHTAPPSPVAKTGEIKPVVAAGAPTGGSKVHVVQTGDTFTSLAVKYLGHARYANLIVKANPGKDAKKLYVGMKLNIPEPPAGAAIPSGKTAVDSAAKLDGKTPAAGKAGKPVKEVVPPPDPSRAYTVQPGEGWFEVAKKVLGDGKEYPELYELNKERVGGDPNVLPAGTVIELPKRAKQPPAKAPVAPPKPAAATATPSKPVTPSK